MRKSAIGQRRYQTRLKPVSGWPALTALIDVMFLLLLFFFLSASFVRVSGISVELPRVRPTNIADMERYIISVVPADPQQPEKGCLVYFNDRPMTVEALKQELNLVHGRSRTASIIILADRRAPHGAVTEIMAIAESSQLASFIVVTPPGQKPETVFIQ